VAGFVRPAVLEVRSAQRHRAVAEVIEPEVPQRFEIEKVPGIFLDGPLAVLATRQECVRHFAHRCGESLRRLSQTFH